MKNSSNARSSHYPVNTTTSRSRSPTKRTPPMHGYLTTTSILSGRTVSSIKRAESSRVLSRAALTSGTSLGVSLHFAVTVMYFQWDAPHILELLHSLSCSHGWNGLGVAPVLRRVHHGQGRNQAHSVGMLWKHF